MTFPKDTGQEKVLIFNRTGSSLINNWMNTTDNFSWDSLLKWNEHPLWLSTIVPLSSTDVGQPAGTQKPELIKG